MKIRYGTLKRLIKEGVSPSVFNNPIVKDPLDKPTLAKAVASIEEPFRQGIMMNFIIGARDSYNEETRELDPAVEQRIKETTEKATEIVMARVHKAIQGAWAEAMNGSQGAEKKAVA